MKRLHGTSAKFEKIYKTRKKSENFSHNTDRKVKCGR